MNMQIYMRQLDKSLHSAQCTGARSQRLLNLLANAWEDSDEVRSSTGRLFHVAGPDTTKSCGRGTQHDECPAVSRPQLPPAKDRRNMSTKCDGMWRHL